MAPTQAPSSPPEPSQRFRSVHRPEEWSLEAAEGGGPFTTRVRWRLPGGEMATWSSRAARKRGTVEIAAPDGEEVSTATAEAETARRLRLVNAVAATAFTIGGSAFAVGAAIALAGTASTLAIASVYMFGGVFFSTGGYASLLQTFNSPRRLGPDGTLVAAPWRWWAYEPERLEWLSALALFVGTLVFGINLVDSFIQELSPVAEDRLVWSPDMIGCALFLISGHLAMVEICHGRPRWRGSDLGWWIVAVNQLGSILFIVAAVASFVRPANAEAINVNIANWATLLGALSFAIAGVLQEFERPKN